MTLDDIHMYFLSHIT